MKVHQVTVRDFLWLLIVVGLSLGWLIDHARQAARYRLLSETIVSVGGLGLTYFADGRVTFHNRGNPAMTLGELDIASSPTQEAIDRLNQRK